MSRSKELFLYIAAVPIYFLGFVPFSGRVFHALNKWHEKLHDKWSGT